MTLYAEEIAALNAEKPSDEAHQYVKDMLGAKGWMPDSYDFAFVLDAYTARKVKEEREACADVADRYALSAAMSAHVKARQAAENAREAVSYESREAIRKQFVADQNYLHGKRHCAVEIARDIRGGE